MAGGIGLVESSSASRSLLGAVATIARHEVSHGARANWPVRRGRIEAGGTVKYHHVQLAIPAGGEKQAKKFWRDVVGFDVIDKPEGLRSRGGVWFRNGQAELHCGVDEDFRPARKAHPAFEVDDLEELAGRLAGASRSVVRDELLSGYRRVYSEDPFGNRLEFVTKG